MYKLLALFIFFICLTPIEAEEFECEEVQQVWIGKIAIEYGKKRPFSFYYPYNYKYYYPRPEYPNEKPRCYWILTKKGYVYDCD